jgi:hypothetical protein
MDLSDRGLKLACAFPFSPFEALCSPSSRVRAMSRGTRSHTAIDVGCVRPE